MKWLYFFVFFVGFAFIFSNYTNAADPQFLITWKAKTSVPSWYSGKALVVKDSSVLVSFSLIEQNGSSAGKLIDLSGSEVRWYIKGSLVQKGKGMTSLTVLNKDFSGNNIEIKIAVSYYDSNSGERFVETYKSIPIVNPEAVVVYKNLLPYFSPGSSVNLIGIPFFFSSDVLKSEWDIQNNSKKINDSYEIKIENAPVELNKVTFSVWNPNKISEKATGYINLKSN